MDWFAAFAQTHQDRCPRRDWPADSDARRALFGVWKAEFVSARVTQTEAEAASLAVASAPPQYLDGHLRALMAKIREARRNAASAGLDGNYADVALARQACRECPTCSGDGLVSVPGPDDGRRFVAAYCWCGAGQAIKRNHLDKEPRLAIRFRQAAREYDHAGAEAVPF